MLHLPGHLGDDAQNLLLDEVVAVLDRAPPFVPTMPRTGKPFSVRMSNCGPLGWVSDKDGGYRYQPHHPDTGEAWPPMPRLLLDLWNEAGGCPAEPEACLINIYGPEARMGLHRDEDEADFSAPVLSVSLGDTARFRIGGLTRKAPTRSFDLESGDVIVLGGESRLAFHGVDRIKPGTSKLALDRVPGVARINLTLRRVSAF